MRSQWGAIENPHAQVFDPPPQAPISPTPGAWPRQWNEHTVWYVLYLLFVRTHTQIVIKIFEIEFVIDI